MVKFFTKYVMLIFIASIVTACDLVPMTPDSATNHYQTENAPSEISTDVPVNLKAHPLLIVRTFGYSETLV
jgi:hypothetical protein